MSDTLKQMKCPACGNEMQKIFIADKSINIDVCLDGCGGIFFDNQEIQEFSNPYEDISEIKDLLKNKNFMPTDESQKRICPACNTPMAKTCALGVQIDTCYQCGGIFLDNGEFELVREKFKKRPPKPVRHISTANEINLNDFYRDAQNEKFAEDAGYAKFSSMFLKRHRRYSLLRLLAELIL